MDGRASVLPRIDQARHAISNIKVEFIGPPATATADIVAFHWMGEENWQVSGIHKFDLVMQQAQWKILSVIFFLENEIGSRDIFGPAINAAREKSLPGWSGVVTE